MFETSDIIAQHNILSNVAELVDKNNIVSTMTQNLGIINAQNLRQAHALIESAKSRGKIVLEGF